MGRFSYQESTRRKLIAWELSSCASASFSSDDNGSSPLPSWCLVTGGRSITANMAEVVSWRKRSSIVVEMTGSEPEKVTQLGEESVVHPPQVGEPEGLVLREAAAVPHVEHGSRVGLPGEEPVDPDVVRVEGGGPREAAIG